MECIEKVETSRRLYSCTGYCTRTHEFVKGPTQLDGMMDHVRQTTAIPADVHGPRVPLDHWTPASTGRFPGLGTRFPLICPPGGGSAGENGIRVFPLLLGPKKNSNGQCR